MRGITMKSSAIALLHADEPARELRAQKRSAESAAGADSSSGSSAVPYLINLIDSPGHVDFSVDVATAARLCDGALVIVDAVEGVCIQTHAVLRTAWAEGVRPALVLNKVDRLITELQLSPLEAYAHLCRILEQVNVIMSSLYTADLLAKLGKVNAAATAAAAATDAAAARSAAAAHAAEASTSDGGEEKELAIDESASPSAATAAETSNGAHVMMTDTWAIEIDEKTEASLFFDPTRGNVVFASAYDGWAFSVEDFAKLHAERLGVSRALLRRALWGDCYYRAKTKKIVTGAAAAAASKGRNLAVSLMLEPLWAVYDSCVQNPNEDRVNKIVSSLKLDVNKRDMASKDAKLKLSAVMRAWLPLHHAVLGMVVRALPSPFEAQRKRLPKLWPSVAGVEALPSESGADSALASKIPPLVPGMTLAQRLARVRACIEHCAATDDAETVVFVSKMFAVPKQSLPDQAAAYAVMDRAALAAAAAAPAAPNGQTARPGGPGAGGGQSTAGMAATAALSLPAAPLDADMPTCFPESMQPLHQEQWLGMNVSDVGSDPIGSSVDLAPVTHPSKRVSASGVSSSRHAASDSSSSAGVDGSQNGVGEDPNSIETFIAFARVFSGVLRPDKPVFVLGPKYEPSDPTEDNCAHISAITRTMPLYVMMGRDLSPIPAAYAGNVIGIGRLGAHVLKTATLCSTPACASLTPMTFQTTPLVRVAIEPVVPTDLPAVERGLALLNQADPCVELTVADTGELQLSALGELHLQRCIKDLQQRFARVELKVSPPILSFMETIVEGPSPVTAPNQSFPPPPVTSPSYLAQGSQSADNSNGADDDVHSSPLASPAASSAGGGGAPGGSQGAGYGGSGSGSGSAVIQLANPSGGGPQFPFSWQESDSGVVYHPPTATVIANTGDKAATLRVRAVPLPDSVTRFLQAHGTQMRLLASEERAGSHASAASATAPSTSSALPLFVEQLRSVFADEGDEWIQIFERIVSFGPKRVGANVLVCKAKEFSGLGDLSSSSSASDAGSDGSILASVWDSIGLGAVARGSNAASAAPPTPPAALASAISTLRSALPQGFQLATSGGPLCGEPVWGLCYLIESIALHPPASSAVPSSAASVSSAGTGATEPSLLSIPSLSTGQLISVMRDACRIAFEAGSQRLVEAYYRCELQCSGGRGGGGEQLGKCYGVLSKRRGRVLAEDLFEGTETFVITALLPVVESFGFADDLRKRTSGAATSPQLLFDRWEILPIDPFFIPTTAEEKEEHGETLHEGQMKNLARAYMDSVRLRKGMAVDRKLVVHADKQRNLSRKK